MVETLAPASTWARIAAMLLVGATQSVSDTQPNLTLGNHAVHASLAATNHQQQTGLRGRHRLGALQAMYFPGLKQNPGRVYMSGVYLNLDIAFIKDHRVTSIAHAKACPDVSSDCRTTNSTGPIDSWVEAPEGSLRNVRAGDIVTLHGANAWDGE